MLECFIQNHSVTPMVKSVICPDIIPIQFGILQKARVFLCKIFSFRNLFNFGSKAAL